MKRDMKKIIFAFLLNLFLVVLLVLVLDLTGTISLESVFSSFGLKDDDFLKIEDRFLLEREELGKQWDVLSLKEREYAEGLNVYASNDQRLRDREDQLLALERQLQEREKKTSENELEKERRSQRIALVASQLMNMQPKQAVERLEEQTDDLLVIDILRAMDAISAEQGTSSLVPYFISLMGKERAAAVQRKMANISTLTNDAEF